MIARWALELENYNYKVKHRSGTSMPHTDALSRCYMVSVVNSEDIHFQLRASQNRDPVISSLREKLESETSNSYVLEDGIVFRKDKAIDFAFMFLGKWKLTS